MWGGFIMSMAVLILLIGGGTFGVWKMIRTDSWRDDMHRLWGDRYQAEYLGFRKVE